MNCDKAIPLLDAYLDRELDVETEMQVDAHVNSCPACAERYNVRRQYQRLLREHVQVEKLPPHLYGRIRQQLRQTVSRHARFAGWRLAWVSTAAVAMMLLVVMLRVYVPAHEVALAMGKGEKYVYHIDEAARANTVLDNIRFHLQATPAAHIVVVTHNQGVDFLLQGATTSQGDSFETKVAALVAKGVEFRVCNNTLNVRHIARSKVIHEAQIVASGIAEVARLQSKEGYAYLKP